MGATEFELEVELELRAALEQELERESAPTTSRIAPERRSKLPGISSRFLLEISTQLPVPSQLLKLSHRIDFLSPDFPAPRSRWVQD